MVTENNKSRRQEQAPLTNAWFKILAIGFMIFISIVTFIIPANASELTTQAHTNVASQTNPYSTQNKASFGQRDHETLTYIAIRSES